MENDNRGYTPQEAEKFNIPKRTELEIGISNSDPDLVENIIDSALDNKDDPDLLFNDLREKNPQVGQFINSMGEFKRSVLFGGYTGLTRWKIGASVMHDLIDNYYESRNQELPIIGDETISTYLNDLMGGESTHHEQALLKENINKYLLKAPNEDETENNDRESYSSEIEGSDTSSFLYLPMAEGLTLQDLMDLTRTPLPEEQRTAIETINNNIASKSIEQKKSFIDNYKNLLVSLKCKVDDTRGLEPEINRKRFYEFVHGAMDILMPYKINEEISSARRRYEAEVK